MFGPNIEGEFFLRSLVTATGSTEGVFSLQLNSSAEQYVVAHNTSSRGREAVIFNAEKSSSLFSGSKLQPSASLCLVAIRF